MTDLMIVGGTQNSETMSSRVMAEFTGTEHSNVLKKIRIILNQLNDKEFNQVNFGFVKYKDKKGELRYGIMMTKSGSLFIASRYDVNLHIANLLSLAPQQ